VAFSACVRDFASRAQTARIVSHATAFCPAFNVRQKAPSGGHAWGGVKTGKGGLVYPPLLTMHFNQRSGL
jgi:hypothetical protein